MSKKNIKTKEPIELQRVDEVQAADFIKIEKNLTSLGFFTPSSKITGTPKAKTISFITFIEGKRETASVTIAPSVLYSLPSTADQDKYFAFHKIISERRREGEQIKNPVSFTSAELLRLLDRRVRTGKNYDDIAAWLKRMTSTTVISESAVYLAGRKSWVSDTFHVFERAISFGHDLPDGSVADKNYVWLSEWQLENINSNHLLPIDFESYKKLKNHIAKALVPILQIWLYTTQEAGVFEKRYDKFCQHLNISEYKHLSKIKEKLSPALNELVEYGYLSSWEVEKTADDKSYKVTFYHGGKFYQDGRKRLAQKATATGRKGNQNPTHPELPLLTTHDSATTQRQRQTTMSVTLNLTKEQDQLIEKLLEHGVHNETAIELVKTAPEEVSLQLEYLPYRTVKKNKGGLLRDAIRGHWTPPDEYLELKKRQLEQQESQERQKKKKAAEVEAEVRRKEEENSKRAYFNYLKERLAQIEEGKPKSYRAFIKDTAAKRTAIENEPAHKGAAKKIHLRLFDDEESYLERARDFFKELSFEKWLK